MKFIKSLNVIIKFSYAVVSSTLFTVGLALDNELLTGISGMALISLLIFRKMNQTRIQYNTFKQIPDQIKKIMTSGEFSDIFKDLNMNDDKKGYQ